MIELSPAFQGWDQAPTHSSFVASATVEVFNRRLGEEHPQAPFSALEIVKQGILCLLAMLVRRSALLVLGVSAFE